MLALQRTNQQQSTETRSLSNLHAAMLEDQAAAAMMLPDVSDIASKENVWRKNRFRNIFEPGALFKVHAPTLIVAASEITELVTQFDAFSADSSFSSQVSSLLSVLYGRNLGIRVFPCGTGVPEKVFSGLFADVADYIGDERPLLVPRFGSDAQDLTVIAQVTRRSAQATAAQPVTRESMEALTARFAEEGATFDRGTLETMLQQMLVMLETSGLLDAPQWPAIGILPLAIYRNVAPVSDFSAIEEQLARDT